MFIKTQKLESLLRHKTGNLRRNSHLDGSQAPRDDGDAHTGGCGAVVTVNLGSGSLPARFESSNFDVPTNISRLVAQPLG
jgi:hypothetical protein